ncbi:hypothetical protein GRI58_05335 [Porphyrobacter algicida]|uniref:Tryptophan 7-halogenase n=1 Tax=Qipengyuania algicida TaxID=1836209 RepID=A0A845AGB4_9SPHN|nr:tryptophan 7-halogenase [Qipengyuania algicida]MXP28243.1 hypothetical protein [Qipengyuania algicida]
MTEPREALRRIVIAGAGQLGVLAAIALKRALPSAEVVVLGIPIDPGALADRAATALPFTNRLHDRLGIDELALVAKAGASHRLITRYVGWGGPGQQAAVPYSTGTEPAMASRFAREWGGGRQGASMVASPTSPAQALAEAGRFAVIPPGEAGPLAEIDYALRWNPQAYRDLLIAIAQQLGVSYLPGNLLGVEPDGHGGIASVSLTGTEPIAADLFVDCSGPSAALLSTLPDFETLDWSNNLPVRKLILSRPGRPLVALEDRVTLLPEGWRYELAGRDGLQVTLGIAPGAAEEVALRALGAPPLIAFDLEPGRCIDPWIGNVLALGDASARFEPVAALNLDLAHRQLDLLIEMLPGRRIEPLERIEYNRRASLMMDAVRDTLALHYIAPAAAVQFGPIALSDDVERLRDQYERRGRTIFREEAPFSNSVMTNLLIALGFCPGVPPQEKTQNTQAAVSALNAKVQSALAFAPQYTSWLEGVLANLARA